MIQPLRISLPQDSLPLGSTDFQPSAVIRNTATGLNIPDNTSIAATPSATYQSTDWFMCAGYNFFSIVAALTAAPGGGVEFMLVPISVLDPTQQLDGISMGSIVTGGYWRASVRAEGLFGAYLRIIPLGGQGATILSIKELTLSKC